MDLSGSRQGRALQHSIGAPASVKGGKLLDQ